MSSNSSDFCNRVDVFNCARSNHAILVAAITANPVVALVTLFIFRLAVYGSFSYAGHPTVSKMVSAAFGTLTGKKSATYDDAWTTLGRYKGNNPEWSDYSFYVVPFVLWILVNHFFPDFVDFAVLVTAVGMVAYRNSRDQRTIFVIGGLTSGMLFVILQMLLDKLATASGNDSEFLIMLVSIAVSVWVVITFLASQNSPGTRKLMGHLTPQHGVAIPPHAGAAPAPVELNPKERFQNDVHSSASLRFDLNFNPETTNVAPYVLNLLKNEFAKKYTEDQTKNWIANKRITSLGDALKKFAISKNLLPPDPPEQAPANPAPPQYIPPNLG